MDFKGHEGHNVAQHTGKESGIEYWVCHDCEKTIGRVTEVYCRPCGYLRPVSGFNKGKKAEFQARKNYKIGV